MAILLLLSSCNQPTQPTEEQASINSALSSLPDLRLKLPKSLSLESSDTAKTVSRAVGDVTDLTTTNVGSVKSDAWMSLQQGSGLIPLLNRAFAIMEDYAGQNTITEGQVFTIPVTDEQLASVIGCGEDGLTGITVQNKFVIKGQDPRDFNLYAQIRITMTQDTSTMQMNVRCKMHLLTPENGLRRIEMLLDCDAGGDIAARVWADIDATTGNCLMVTGTIRNGVVDTANMGVMIAEAGSDGSITDIDTYVYTDANQNSRQGSYVAYGDDTAGGIASIFTDSSEETSYYRGEYYNGKGDIIYRTDGSTTLWCGPSLDQALNLKETLASVGIASAPETIYIRATWENGTMTYEAKTDDTTDWIPLTNPNNYLNWYYMTGDDWTIGDVYYYCRNYSYNNNIYTYTLYAGFKVPEKTSFNGRGYYVTQEYPLRNLLPLTDASFCLKQREESPITCNWTDSDGVWHSTQSPCYSFWLENISNTNPAGTATECNISDGDIDLADKLGNYEMYYYSSGTMSRIRSYFFRTTTGLPAYFANPDPSGLVDSIEAKLRTALDLGVAINYSNYTSYVNTSLKDDPVIATMAF